MPDDPSNEVVVIVPDDSGTLAANIADSADTSGSTSVTEEIIDVILDPFGSADNSAGSATAPEGVLAEFFVADPVVDSSAIGSEGYITNPMDGTATSAGAYEPEGMVDPVTDAPGINIEGNSTDPIETSDLTGDLAGAEAGAVDSGAATSDADPVAGIDSTADTTDPDTQFQSDALSDDQQTLQQDEQAEGQAAASGDYGTAQDDAQQAYSASQDVANAGGPDNTDETWQASQDESWANWDQQTADENAQTAESYANDTTGNPDDAADAALYAGDAQDEQANADAAGEAGEYGDSQGPEDDTSAVADDAPVDDTPVDDSASSVDDDSSSGD